jgi:hypothetical protein
MPAELSSQVFGWPTASDLALTQRATMIAVCLATAAQRQAIAGSVVHARSNYNKRRDSLLHATYY